MFCNRNYLIASLLRKRCFFGTFIPKISLFTCVPRFISYHDYHIRLIQGQKTCTRNLSATGMYCVSRGKRQRFELLALNTTWSYIEQEGNLWFCFCARVCGLFVTWQSLLISNINMRSFIIRQAAY